MHVLKIVDNTKDPMVLMVEVVDKETSRGEGYSL